MFPEVKLQAQELITDEYGIYTNGGAYSFLNLMLYLVEKYYDRQTAIFCSKVFQIEMDRKSQAGFTIFTGQKQPGDDIVKKAQRILKQTCRKNFQSIICLQNSLSVAVISTGGLSGQPATRPLNTCSA